MVASPPRPDDPGGNRTDAGAFPHAIPGKISLDFEERGGAQGQTGMIHEVARSIKCVEREIEANFDLAHSFAEQGGSAGAF